MEEFIWVERYRPHTIKDVILPKRMKSIFEGFAKEKNSPNLLLAGGPGCGKTTIALAFLEDIGASHIFLNASTHGNIGTLRTTITEFASSVAFNKRRKFVILDEADKMSPDMQDGLRAFIETFSKNCGFILTCNYPERIDNALHSRLSKIEFKFSKEDNKEIIVDFYKRITQILALEGVEYEKQAIAEMIKKHFPDMRRIIGDLQLYAKAGGKIDVGILTHFDDVQLKQVISLMKEKNFTELRKWVSEATISENDFYTSFYEAAAKHMVPDSIPQLVMILAKYSYQSGFCLNKDINLMSCLTECMIELEFK